MAAIADRKKELAERIAADEAIVAQHQKAIDAAAKMKRKDEAFAAKTDAALAAEIDTARKNREAYELRSTQRRMELLSSIEKEQIRRKKEHTKELLAALRKEQYDVRNAQRAPLDLPSNGGGGSGRSGSLWDWFMGDDGGSRGSKDPVDHINRVAFTFRRLIGIFAAFQGIRAAASAFRQVVNEAIALNQQIESAVNGIAAIATASAELRDPWGNVLKPAEAFAAATGLAREQLALLRVDALQTNATFEDLLKTFQSATAPGLEAGLSLDQIRQMTVRIAQAAAAVGIPSDQLDEEIRSVLTGATTSRTTRIAQVLGGAKEYNQQFRDAKEAGILRAQGVEAGAPDLLIFDAPTLDLSPEEAEIACALRTLPPDSLRRVLQAAGGAVGHAIELKRAEGGVVSPAQRVWLERLAELGWRTAVCHGWAKATAQLTAWGFKV
jgi:hypothetical protein